jgi:predicted nucleic acid-binding protein
LILIDSSSWIHFLRPNGDVSVRERVERALRDGDACWCPMVRLELWNGAGGDKERSVLRQFERVLPDLAINDAVWKHAEELARAARSAGVTVPATDILIVACARHHGADVESADSDFDQLAAVRVR